jgi:hypothetical protein
MKNIPTSPDGNGNPFFIFCSEFSVGENKKRLQRTAGNSFRKNLNYSFSYFAKFSLNLHTFKRKKIPC